ncbi:ABC transporter ATP-binding protein [Granulosicoccus sp. 3-233]|uniref:ABC transporter ATP-binding protein n=1 Tax=Granulosicoccus sp. 3-233 TaxID=3417969 RepID=UPI003D32FCB7
MSQNAETLVQLQGVSKRFGSVIALDDLDIDIKAGEFVTFLGPSGCGKSTTLRILGGFEKPDNGRVILDGEDVTHLPPNKRKVNMVFQDYALFPHMSVAQNIDFGLELKGMTVSQIEARRQEVMSFLELDEFGSRYPDQLSGGQRQRVALARALAPDPALLLLDEPLGALDAKLRSQVQQELKAIQRRTNTTFFFVTHDQDEALTMSDRIVVMNQGKVEQDGTPEDLYLRPASRFVAEFIGETNLLSGQCLGMEGEEVVIDWHGSHIRARAGGLRPIEGSEVTCSLRLEKLSCSPGHPGTDTAIAAHITNKVFMGSRTAVTASIDAAPDVQLRAYVDAELAIGSVGDAVQVGWDNANLALLRQ